VLWQVETSAGSPPDLGASHPQIGTQAGVSGERRTIWRRGHHPPPGNLHAHLTRMLSLPLCKIIAEQIASEGEFLDYGVMILNGCLSVFSFISLQKKLLKFE
jgi:hypothetical protein